MFVCLLCDAMFVSSRQMRRSRRLQRCHARAVSDVTVFAIALTAGTSAAPLSLLQNFYSSIETVQLSHERSIMSSHSPHVPPRLLCSAATTTSPLLSQIHCRRFSKFLQLNADASTAQSMHTMPQNYAYPHEGHTCLYTLLRGMTELFLCYEGHRYTCLLPGPQPQSLPSKPTFTAFPCICTAFPSYFHCFSLWLCCSCPRRHHTLSTVSTAARSSMAPTLALTVERLLLPSPRLSAPLHRLLPATSSKL